VIAFFPPYAFFTAASSTRCDARQMSGPVPSPSMKGMIGSFGTCRPFGVIVIVDPARTPLPTTAAPPRTARASICT
jgi:hypothetical protein